MSTPKFASITSGLLARKGEARPWTEPDKTSLTWQSPERPPVVPAIMPAVPPTPMPTALPTPIPAPMPAATPAVMRAPMPAMPAPIKAINLPPPPLPPVDNHAQKKCTIRMTPQEYEQLGILAVKRDCHRQQLLRQALDQFFAAMAQEYRSQCACLGESGGTGEGCCGGTQSYKS